MSQPTMSRLRLPTLLAAALATGLAAPVARAQEPAVDTAGIHVELRSFYYSLSHRDWEAIAAQVLSAKVVAHRPPPAAMVAGEAAVGRAAGLACGASRVSVEGAWAEVSVARCEGGVRGADEFRLIQFERRWRIVYIDLYRAPVSVTAER